MIQIFVIRTGPWGGVWGSSAFNTFPRDYNRWWWRRLCQIGTHLLQIPLPKCPILHEKRTTLFRCAQKVPTRPLAGVTQNKLWMISHKLRISFKNLPSFPCLFYSLYFDRVWPRIRTFFDWWPSCYTVLLDREEFHSLPTGTGNITLSTRLKLQWLRHSKHPNIWLLIPKWDIAD